jgi:predicted RND superfamily exporter protein
MQGNTDYDFDVKPRIKFWVNQLLNWRYVLLALSLLAGIAAFPVAQRLQFDRSLERLFHESDPRLKNYIESKEIFGAQETCFIAYSDPALVSAEGMERLEQSYRPYLEWIVSPVWQACDCLPTR